MVKSDKHGFEFFAPSFQKDLFGKYTKSEKVYIDELELKIAGLTEEVIHLEDIIDIINKNVSYYKNKKEENYKLCVNLKSDIQNLKKEIYIVKNENEELKQLTQNLTDRNEELTNELKKEIETTNDKELCKCKSKCSICFTEKKRYALVPCGHLFCETCSRKIMTDFKKCPTCKQNVQQFIKIFF